VCAGVMAREALEHNLQRRQGFWLPQRTPLSLPRVIVRLFQKATLSRFFLSGKSQSAAMRRICTQDLTKSILMIN